MPNVKSHKCASCGRVFKTAQGLADHRRVCRGAQPSPRREKKRQRGRGRPQASAPVSQPGTVFQDTGSDFAVMSGVDRIFHLGDISKAGEGQLIYQSLIDASSMKRLQAVTLAWQRMSWEQLEFRVVPQVSTATSGGYVVSFVADADEDVSTLRGESLLVWASAQRSSVTNKWWQNSVLRPQIPRKDFYTSPGPEKREYSPGQLVLVSDGKASQPGSLTVYAHWKVRLHSGSIEAFKPQQDVIVTRVDIWVRRDHAGVWYKKPDGSFADDVKGMIQGLKVGQSVRMPYPADFWVESVGPFAIHWMLVKTANDVMPCQDSPTTPITGNSQYDKFFLPAGTTLELVLDKSGNDLGASSCSQSLAIGHDGAIGLESQAGRVSPSWDSCDCCSGQASELNTCLTLLERALRLTKERLA